MLDAGTIRHRDLNVVTYSINCDMGEAYGIYSLGDDEGLMPLITHANVACGFHASDPSVMARTVRLARAHGVEVGAHPSLPDRQGFGRRVMAIEPDELTEFVIYQVGALRAFLDAESLSLSHVKPHGALYGMTARNLALARALCSAVRVFRVPLLGMASSMHETACTEMGVDLIGEFYADLEYGDDGHVIAPRVHHPIDVAKSVARTRRALDEGQVLTATGDDRPIRADSICVHSDTPNAVALAYGLREMLARRPAAQETLTCDES